MSHSENFWSNGRTLVEKTPELMQLPDKKYAGDTKIPSVLQFVEKLVPAYFATTFQDS